MVNCYRALKLLSMITMVIAIAGTSSAQKRVTGAAGSTDVERVEPILVGETFVYSVKMLCGTVLSDLNLRQFPSASGEVLMVPGTYLSAVNYHNPTEEGEPVDVVSSTVVQSGQVGFVVGAVTNPNAMGHLDCNAFVSNLNGNSTTFEENRTFLKLNFVEGFTVLRSPIEIAVTAIYTFKNVEAPSFILVDTIVEPPRTP